MTLLQHLRNVLEIKADAALSQSEDPAQVFERSYSLQSEKLQQMKQAIADVISHEKEVEMYEAQATLKSSRLDDQARQALQQNREDLARLALQQKEALSVQLTGLKEQFEHLHADHLRLAQAYQQAEQRLQTFRNQKDMATTQYQAALAEAKAGQIATGLDAQSAQMNEAMQRAQNRVLQAQAHAQAYTTLMESGELGSLSGDPGQTPLDQQLQQLTSQHNVDEQLAALKQQLQIGPPANH